MKKETIDEIESLGYQIIVRKGEYVFLKSNTDKSLNRIYIPIETEDSVILEKLK